LEGRIAVSVQFGKWSFDGRPSDREELNRTETILAPYGRDGTVTCVDGLSIVYRAFPTNRESRHETQPLCLSSGAILTWDGRLDNGAELLRELPRKPPEKPSDVAIVAAVYEAEGTAGFARLIGDWALSVWEPSSRSLVLAKDAIGIRPLYYTFDGDQVVWSSILDPLVLLAGRSFGLDEEYIAGWLTFFPAPHLTPYAGIHSVPPSSFVQLARRRHVVTKYWDFDSSRKIRYRDDRDYEEHFRQTFALSVRRRLRCKGPVLAELSGGMDSSSIVCMADALLSCGDAEACRLDTVSYYNEAEPNWNERPYFAKVEEKRGRVGVHIDVRLENTDSSQPHHAPFVATPSACVPPSKAYREFAAHVAMHGYRVLLSGVGGDEFTGGVPTPIPELGDLFATGHFIELARRLKVWALNKKQPWLHLLHETVGRFVPFGTTTYKSPPPWLQPDFVARNRSALAGYATRLKLFGSLPTFQENLGSLAIVRRQFGCQALPSEPHYEKRYPYLDRSLLEFLLAIPREQLVRPGERRSLMRRSLREIVPSEILTRKRKAYMVRTPLIALATSLQLKNDVSLGEAAGIFDRRKLREAVSQAVQGLDISLVSLQRTLVLEDWLARLAGKNLISGAAPTLPSSGGRAFAIHALHS
jgi:asparagine synthase (glutamine-hydrolysing)